VQWHRRSVAAAQAQRRSGTGAAVQWHRRSSETAQIGKKSNLTE